MNKQSFIKLYCAALLSLFMSHVSAQSVSPGVTNLSGGSVTIGANIYEWSIGEMALVESLINSQLIATNGLLQPQKLTPVPLEMAAVTPTNILSPDGDGQNDVWVIENLNDFPDNEVKVFDRAGRLVFQAKNYQNNWNGFLEGQQLAEDTYFYVIVLKRGAEVGTKKGFITIVKQK